MTIRRRSAFRKQRKQATPPVESPPPPLEHPTPAANSTAPLKNVEILNPAQHSHPDVETHPAPETQKSEPARDGYLPLAVILEILAREYEDSAQGEALCRAAVSLAEESGAMDLYRARWEAEETDLSGRLSVLLFDRRQSLELIGYYKSKKNQQALQKELDNLRRIEGRLLLGAASPAKITEEDLEELERYIKECGF